VPPREIPTGLLKPPQKLNNELGIFFSLPLVHTVAFLSVSSDKLKMVSGSTPAIKIRKL
jgi:hypothetical protein